MSNQGDEELTSISSLDSDGEEKIVSKPGGGIFRKMKDPAAIDKDPGGKKIVRRYSLDSLESLGGSRPGSLFDNVSDDSLSESSSDSEDSQEEWGFGSGLKQKKEKTKKEEKVQDSEESWARLFCANAPGSIHQDSSDDSTFQAGNNSPFFEHQDEERRKKEKREKKAKEKKPETWRQREARMARRRHKWERLRREKNIQRYQDSTLVFSQPHVEDVQEDAALHFGGVSGYQLEPLTGDLQVADILHYLFLWLPSKMPTLMSVSFVCRSWRQLTEKLPQWSEVRFVIPSTVMNEHHPVWISSDYTQFFRLPQTDQLKLKDIEKRDAIDKPEESVLDVPKYRTDKVTTLIHGSRSDMVHMVTWQLYTYVQPLRRLRAEYRFMNSWALLRFIMFCFLLLVGTGLGGGIGYAITYSIELAAAVQIFAASTLLFAVLTVFRCGHPFERPKKSFMFQLYLIHQIERHFTMFATCLVSYLVMLFGFILCLSVFRHMRLTEMLEGNSVVYQLPCGGKLPNSTSIDSTFYFVQFENQTCAETWKVVALAENHPNPRTHLAFGAFLLADRSTSNAEIGNSTTTYLLFVPNGELGENSTIADGNAAWSALLQRVYGSQSNASSSSSLSFRTLHPNNEGNVWFQPPDVSQAEVEGFSNATNVSVFTTLVEDVQGIGPELVQRHIDANIETMWLCMGLTCGIYTVVCLFAQFVIFYPNYFTVNKDDEEARCTMLVWTWAFGSLVFGTSLFGALMGFLCEEDSCPLIPTPTLGILLGVVCSVIATISILVMVLVAVRRVQCRVHFYDDDLTFDAEAEGVHVLTIPGFACSFVLCC